MKKYITLLFGILFTNSSCQQRKTDEFETKKQAQIYSNQKVISALVKEGDKLVIPREVFHWIYFKSNKERNNFIQEVSKEGFEVVGTNKIDDKFPYQLQIKRIDKVDKNSVNKYVIYLWELSIKHKGDYDGWETSVEKH